MTDLPPIFSLSPLIKITESHYTNLGAATGTIVYDTTEPWSLANVVTLCGIESAIPIPTQGLIESDQNKDNAEQERNQRCNIQY